MAIRNMRYLVTVGKHVNDIPAIARQQLTTTIKELSAPRLYNKYLRPADIFQCWQFSSALQARLREMSIQFT
jgi:hypothetical protein